LVEGQVFGAVEGEGGQLALGVDELVEGGLVLRGEVLAKALKASDSGIEDATFAAQNRGEGQLGSFGRVGSGLEVEGDGDLASARDSGDIGLALGFG
jgi:hypothetical protein